MEGARLSVCLGLPNMEDDYDWTRERNLESLRLACTRVADDPEGGLRDLLSLAREGSPAAMVHLAWELSKRANGRGAPSEAPEYWYDMANRLGCKCANHYLAKHYLEGGATERAKAVLAMEHVTEYSPALYTRAIIALEESDFSRATALLERAAAKGHLFAMRKLINIKLRRWWLPSSLAAVITLILSLLRGVWLTSRSSQPSDRLRT